MRRTKILATLGPASSDAAVIRALIDAGADAFRLNFSHGTADAHAALCRSVRAEAHALGRHVLVLQDLGGPKIRTGVLAAPIMLVRGDIRIIEHGDGPGEQGRITSTFAPPWLGPFRVPMAEVMHEYMSDSVPAVTRAEKVDAFIPCSAWSTKATSIVFTRVSFASSPFSR